MRTLILILWLLAAAILMTAQEVKMPDPKWLETPVPHWSCPAQIVVKDRIIWLTVEDVSPPMQPHCVQLPTRRKDILFYDYEAQERIKWTQAVKVPKSGIVRLDWPAEFVKRPGCDVEGTVYKFSEEEKDHLTILGKAGETLQLHCTGLLTRK
jgi:hypothetical protein